MVKPISASLGDASRLLEAALAELVRKLDSRHTAAAQSLYASAVSVKRLAERLLQDSDGLPLDEGRGRHHISGAPYRKAIRDDEAGVDPQDYRERRSGDTVNE